MPGNDEDGVVSKPQYVECNCFHDTHTLRFWIPDQNEFEEMYISTFLAPTVPFHRRLMEGLKYIFGVGKPCVYGHFQETVIGREQAVEIRDLMSTFLESCKELR
jgi:hypothetical protein